MFDNNRQCGFKCLKCKGDEEQCGRNQENFLNETTSIKLEECGNGGACWVSRIEKDKIVSFKRECQNITCTDTTNKEHCKVIEGARLCEKCCTGEKCNTYFNDGKARCNIISSKIALFPLTIFIMILFNHKMMYNVP